MLSVRDLIDLRQSRPVDVGGKADGVHWLMTRGARVPNSWGVPYRTVEAVAAGASLASPTDRSVAVRSSANREDGVDSSLAGQLASVMDVDADDLSEAVRAVHASGQTSTVAEFLEAVPGEPLRVGVLIQEMVEPVVSGVSFSRNPVTGLNEVVIEAVEGSGEQLVQGGVSPLRWVRRWGGWSEAPEAAGLPDEVAAVIADETTRLAEAYQRPADLEWVWDGTDVWWVQIRPIVGIDDIDVFSNRISREVLPGLIKPLVWSVNVPVVNGAWIRLISEAIGSNDLEADDLAKQFAYRAYFNMGTMGRIFEQLGMQRDLLEVLLGLDGDEKPSFKPSMGIAKHLPRMMGLTFRLYRHHRTIQPQLSALRAAYENVPTGDLETIDTQELLQRVDQLMDVTSDAAYSNIVTPLLANLWAGRLRSRLNKAGIDAEAVDISDGRPSNDDPAPAMRSLSVVLQSVPTEITSLKQLAVDHPDSAAAVDRFLDRFGHFSDSGNDFSVPTWRDDPLPLLNTLRTDTQAPDGSHLSSLATKIPRGVRTAQRRALTYQHLRDEVSSLYTAGYGRLRPLMIEVGRRLVSEGHLDQTEDVFFATLSEVRSPPPDLRDRVASRTNELERVRDVSMPETIYGNSWSPVTVEASDTLRGLATSRGQHRGTARVVRGVTDGVRIDQGDVLVIPFSDVGWTPMFLRAGAVVSESGGMLAHASIVARELGIPCVVSVEGALSIPDGSTVWVDGQSGQVAIEAT